MSLSDEEWRTLADGVRRERNRLVALLAALYPASLEKSDAPGDFDWFVMVEIPTGQAGWRIEKDELPLFSHVKRNQNWEWDGHTTEEKYRRVRALGRKIVAQKIKKG